MVRSDACGMPISSRTRTESALLVGSMIRASTSCWNAASSMTSNPSRSYTVVRTCHSSADRFAVITPGPVVSGVLGQRQVQCLLPGTQPSAGLDHEHGQLGLGSGRPDVLQDHVTPGPSLRDLHLCAARAAGDLPDERHRTDLTQQRGVSTARRPASCPA